MIKSCYQKVILEEIAGREKNAIVDGPFGSSLQVKDYVKDGIPVLQGKNISNNKFVWEDIRYINEEKARELQRSKVKIGDILIVKIGSIGYSAEVKHLNGYPYAIIPANLAKVTVDENKIHKRFLCLWLNSKNVTEYLKKNASKTAQPALSLTKIKQIPILLPCLDTQKKIADILDKSQDLIDRRKEQIQKLDEFVQSVFFEMFGDPVDNRRGWDLYNLRQISHRFSDGPFGSNLKTEHYSERGIRVIRLQNIGRGKFLDNDKVYVYENHYNEVLQNYTCYPGDVVIATMGNPNIRACIIPDYIKVAINKADCVLCRPDSGVVNNKYLVALINSPSFLSLASNLLHGQTRTRVSMGQLAELRVPIPPLDYQGQFAIIAQKAEQQKRLMEQSLAEMEANYNSIMQRAFRGELF